MWWQHLTPRNTTQQVLGARATYLHEEIRSKYQENCRKANPGDDLYLSLIWIVRELKENECFKVHSRLWLILARRRFATNITGVGTDLVSSVLCSNWDEIWCNDGIPGLLHTNVPDPHAHWNNILIQPCHNKMRQLPARLSSCIKGHDSWRPRDPGIK